LRPAQHAFGIAVVGGKRRHDIEGAGILRLGAEDLGAAAPRLLGQAALAQLAGLEQQRFYRG
jgi:hypothetical protein